MPRTQAPNPPPRGPSMRPTINPYGIAVLYRSIYPGDDSALWLHVGSGHSQHEIQLPDNGTTPLTAAVDRIDEIYPELRQLWIHGSALEFLGLPARIPPRRPGEASNLPYWPLDHDRFPISPARLARWANFDLSRGLSLAVADYETGSPDGLGELEPRDLIDTLISYATHVGSTYRYSARHTGAALMHTTNLSRSRVGRSSLTPPPPARVAGLESDLLWVRDQTAAERARDWIVTIDQRSRYLASCSSVSLGIGTAQHVEAQRWGIAGDNPAPGYFRVSWLPSPAPDLLDPFARSQDWISRPTLELALQLGRIDSVLEAYVYPEYRRYLRPFYERLSGARKAADAAGAYLAADLIKQTYTKAIGSLAGSWQRPGDLDYRPDWRHAIIAQSRANTYRGILKIQRDLSLPEPYRVSVDAAYFCVDTAQLTAIRSYVALGTNNWRLQDVTATS